MAASLWILGSAALLVCMAAPVSPTPTTLVISTVGLSLAPFLLVPAAAGIAFCVLAFRHRWRVVGTVSLVLTLSLVAGAAVPTLALARTAADRDVPLSVAGLVGSPEGGLEEPTTTVTYSGSLQMDVWQAPGDANGTRPALIYVFGGAFHSGDRAQWSPFFRHLTSRGVSVFAMDYRLSTATHPTWDEAPADVADAVAWVRGHAAEYDVDPDRLVLSGGSAGGNLALLSAYSTEGSVRAVVDFYGPFDLAQTARTTASPSVVDALEQYLGASVEEDPERYAALSPSSHVSPDDPPTLILQGGHDTGVPAEQSSELADALTGAGVPHELVVLPWTQHGFDAAYGSFAHQIAMTEIDRFFARFVTNS